MMNTCQISARESPRWLPEVLEPRTGEKPQEGRLAVEFPCSIIQFQVMLGVCQVNKPFFDEIAPQVKKLANLQQKQGVKSWTDVKGYGFLRLFEASFWHRLWIHFNGVTESPSVWDLLIQIVGRARRGGDYYWGMVDKAAPKDNDNDHDSFVLFSRWNVVSSPDIKHIFCYLLVGDCMSYRCYSYLNWSFVIQYYTIYLYWAHV